MLTKTDLEGTDRTPVLARIAELNPTALVIIALHGRIDPGIFDTGVFTSSLLASQVAGVGLKPAPTSFFARDLSPSEAAEEAAKLDLRAADITPAFRHSPLSATHQFMR